MLCNRGDEGGDLAFGDVDKSIGPSTTFVSGTPPKGFENDGNRE